MSVDERAWAVAGAAVGGVIISGVCLCLAAHLTGRDADWDTASTAGGRARRGAPGTTRERIEAPIGRRTNRVKLPPPVFFAREGGFMRSSWSRCSLD
ncbi:MAG: hypothetical protein ACR2NR_07320 [Solirubrobacteraceae bacterium]